MNTPKYFPTNRCDVLKNDIETLEIYRKVGEYNPKPDKFYWNFKLFMRDEINRLRLEYKTWIYEKECVRKNITKYFYSVYVNPLSKYRIFPGMRRFLCSSSGNTFWNSQSSTLIETLEVSF